MAVPTCLGLPTGVHVTHMRDWRTFLDSRRLVTHNAARARGTSGGCGIAVGNPASLAILDAPDFHAASGSHASNALGTLRGQARDNDEAGSIV